MCIFSWDRWTCGHFAKTRIEYCWDACNTPTIITRDFDPLCHMPGDDPELCRHIEAKCKNCVEDTQYDHPQGTLRYIPLRDLSPSVSPSRRQSYETWKREYAEIRKQLHDVRQHIHRQQTECSNNIWHSITFLTRKLLECEDHYRQIGARYYSQGWFAHTLLEGHEHASQPDALLADAFHGNTDQRKFFQPWSDFEASLKIATNHLLGQKLDLAVRECKSSFKLVEFMEKALNKVNDFVKAVEYRAAFNTLHIEDWPDFDLIRSRNTAM